MHKKLKNYVAESFQELGKVTWPTRNRAIQICILVLVFISVSAAFLAAVDFGFHQGYSALLDSRLK